VNGAVTAAATPLATATAPAVTVAATANGKKSGARNGEKYTCPCHGPPAIAGATVMNTSTAASDTTQSFFIDRASLTAYRRCRLRR